MNGWITLWTALFAIALTIFAAVAIVVTIGGFFDIRAMFARIKAQHEADSEERGRTR